MASPDILPYILDAPSYACPRRNDIGRLHLTNRSLITVKKRFCPSVRNLKQANLLVPCIPFTQRMDRFSCSLLMTSIASSAIIENHRGSFLKRLQSTACPRREIFLLTDWWQVNRFSLFKFLILSLLSLHVIWSCCKLES